MRLASAPEAAAPVTACNEGGLVGRPSRTRKIPPVVNPGRSCSSPCWSGPQAVILARLGDAVGGAWPAQLDGDTAVGLPAARTRTAPEDLEDSAQSRDSGVATLGRRQDAR